MLNAIKQDFKIFNTTVRAYSELADITRTIVVSYYESATEAA